MYIYGVLVVSTDAAGDNQLFAIIAEVSREGINHGKKDKDKYIHVEKVERMISAA
jgi:hypothetical protein